MKKFKPAVVTDFDGTVTTRDSLTLLLDRHGPPDWKRFERMYSDRKITRREALEEEVGLLEISLQRMLDIVREVIEIDPSFPLFVTWCRENNIPLQIVSCNFQIVIQTVLEKYGLGHLSVRANEIVESESSFVVTAGKPQSEDCGECHMCKMMSVKELKERGHTVVYCGDGLSDRCPAWEADIVFGRGGLNRQFKELGFSVRDLKDFADIQKQMSGWLGNGIPYCTGIVKLDRDPAERNPFMLNS